MEIIQNIIIGIDNLSNNPIYLDSSANINELPEISNIGRENRRRSVSITILTKPMDPRYIKSQLDNFLNKLVIPQGYVIEFDKNAIQNAKKVSDISVLFVIAFIFCYIIIAVINESFIIPVIALSIIPPSIALSVFYLIIASISLNIQVACAFIVICGLAINSAIYSVGSIDSVFSGLKYINSARMYCIIRSKVSALFLTAITTILSAVPFIFLNEISNKFIQILSIIMVIGVSMSFLCSISIIPSLYILTRKFYKK